MMDPKCRRMDIASRCQCTLKCMPSSTSLACHRPSRSKFKGWNGGFHGKHIGHHQIIEQKANRSQKGAQGLRVAFQGPHEPQSHHAPGLRLPKGKGRRTARSQHRRPQGLIHNSESSSNTSGDGSGSESTRSLASYPDVGCYGKEKGWHARRRDPRVNGADIYVARFTKNGTGSARPCWRCLEWCKWAGIKRIFHWNDEEGRFDVVKVNSAQGNLYETHADFRLFAGLGW
ncbi:hypothetical protein AcW1_002295 [Taiwanofungus camphoratus]|nr:hypothetical protein AcV5_010297 [Antrodia cinnamomea]KAI0944626.1 hypothetical protein AcW1_002295 [Antrodia cinnamomea]